jgi:hypothetical protein
MQRRLGNPVNFKEIRKLKTHHRRDANIIAHFELIDDRIRNSRAAVAVKPDNDMGIQINHGRHSLDQSMCTISFGEPLR